MDNRTEAAYARSDVPRRRARTVFPLRRSVHYSVHYLRMRRDTHRGAVLRAVAVTGNAPRRPRPPARRGGCGAAGSALQCREPVSTAVRVPVAVGANKHARCTRCICCRIGVLHAILPPLGVRGGGREAERLGRSEVKGAAVRVDPFLKEQVDGDLSGDNVRRHG